MGFDSKGQASQIGGLADLAAKERQAEAAHVNAVRDFGQDSAEAVAAAYYLEGLRRRRRSVAGPMSLG